MANQLSQVLVRTMSAIYHASHRRLIMLNQYVYVFIFARWFQTTAADTAFFIPLVRAGMAAFVQGDVTTSLLRFDEAAAADATKRPLLWQRGLSLFYQEQYALGAEQFRLDVAANPNDTEESIWALICEARLVQAIYCSMPLSLC